MTDPHPTSRLTWPWRILIALVILITYFRTYFGIGHTDEMQYVGSSVLEAIGGKPFVNESYIQQVGSLLTTPFMELYIALRGSTDGVILAARHLYFFFYLGLFFMFRSSLLRIFPKRNVEITLGALVFLTYTHNTVPNLCYNTTGTALLTVSILSLLNSFHSRPWLWGALSGLCVVLAVISYPTLIVAVFFMLLAGFVSQDFLRDRKFLKSTFPFVLLGAAGTALASTVWLLSFGWENLLGSFRFTVLFDIGGDWESKKWLWNHHWSLYKEGWPWGLGLLIPAFLIRWWVPLQFSVASIFGFLTYLNWDVLHPSFGHFLVTLIAVAGLYFSTRTAETSAAFRRLRAVALGLTISAPVIGWTSSGTVTAFPVATQIAASFGLFFWCLAARPGRWASTALATALVCNGLLLSIYLTHFMGDMPLHSSIARMESGPYEGLYTFQARKDFFNQVAADLREARASGQTVFFTFYAMGYLQSDLRPGGRALLAAGLEKPGVLQTHYEYFQKYGSPDIYFELKSYPALPDLVDDLDDGLRWQVTQRMRAIIGTFANYTLLKQTPFYLIWKKTSGPLSPQ